MSPVSRGSRTACTPSAPALQRRKSRASAGLVREVSTKANPIMIEYREIGAPRVTKPMTEGPERQRSDRTRRPRFMRKTLIAIAALVAIGAGVYFLAVYPRIQNYQALNAAAAAAGKKAVPVVEPTQTWSAPDRALPAKIQANERPSIFARADASIAAV